ncbi:MAG: response regulator transcription factor [Phaeodactylibacter sp.]|nr:response regulator transcription factor [Phaeodactylibacter sp.]
MNQPVNLLLVDDEATLGFIVKESLESRGFAVRYCEDGALGWAAFQEQRPDVCILDVMMPKRDGFSLATAIREVAPYVPLIFLTAKSQTKDVVKGFDLGANDYIRKPFSMEELIVRVRALLRDRSMLAQQPSPAKSVWEIGQFAFDVQRQTLSRGENVRKLTHREVEILDRLCRHRNQVMERKAILLELWGDDTFFNARSMDVFITKLRKYLKPDPQVEIINVRGVGYKLIC